MKKKQLLLAMLIASSVVACSSSDDGDDDAARRAAEEKAAAEKAAAEKAAAEAAAKKKAAEEAAKKAAEEAARKKAAQLAGIETGNVSGGTDLITDAEAAKLTKPGSKPGHLITSNNKSNFIVNETTATTSDASKALEMTQNGLDNRLDTIVVAYPHKEGDKTLGYLEDFQFIRHPANGGTVKIPDAVEGNQEHQVNEWQGVAKMEHIYFGSATKGVVSQPRNYETNTKTNMKGMKDGIALVYQEGRLVYFGDEKELYAHSDRLTRKNHDDANEAIPDAAGKRSTPRGLIGTTAEVYGVRTFVKGGHPEVYNEDGKYLEAMTDNPDQKNLPLAEYEISVNKLSNKDARLRNVQYGRVTTSLHDADFAKYKDGAERDTKVVPYGKFGNKGTENVYFYRGLNNTTGAQLAKVKEKGGKLAYHGHAVSYGLDNNYMGGAVAGSRPNAIGGGKDYRVYSGNHMYGELDLETNKFSNGSIYNVLVAPEVLANNIAEDSYELSEKDKTRVALVKFDGTLDNMGNITGSATRLTHASANEGTFNATLYGKDIGELGGAVASVDQSAANKWGAVFGAKSAGVQGAGNPWAAATDENNNGKVD